MRPVIYFIRHGQTDWNAEMRFQGQIDVPINATGRDQARRNGERLAGLIGKGTDFAFVASPLARARETMEIIGGALGRDPAAYRLDDRLKEIAYGDWQGLTLAETQRLFPELHSARMRDKWNFVPPGEGAESYAMQTRRFASWLSEVDRPTVCVTHGGILRCAWHLAGGLSARESGGIEIPQDRILRLEEGRLDWL
jgi:probable phosphoglycerate mutase